MAGNTRKDLGAEIENLRQDQAEHRRELGEIQKKLESLIDNVGQMITSLGLKVDEKHDELKRMIEDTKLSMEKIEIERQKEYMKLRRSSAEETDRLFNIMEDRFNNLSFAGSGSRTRNQYLRVQRPRYAGDSISNSSYDKEPIF